MTIPEAIEVLAQDLPCETDEDLVEAMAMAIKALEPQPCEDCINRNDKRIIHTDGLEEGIRCAMCTNPMANDRGCDGGCIVNESMYQNVLNVIKKQILEQEPCEDAISRQAVHDLIAELLSDYLHDEDREKIEELDVKIEDLKPVTPKEKTGMWINDWEMGMSECSCCGETYLWEDHKGTENFHYCPNCGARMTESEDKE